MATTPARILPWPGPRPYRAADKEFFFGRQREIEDIRRRVLAQELTILSGASGTGKTSLIQAGVLWDLLADREAALVDHRATAGPVLLLADWGGVQGEAVEGLIRKRLEDAIRALADRSERDYKMLAEAYATEPEARESLLDDVSALCNRSGAIILILDQFEEVLRSGEKQADEAVDLIAELYRFEPRAHLLISLREEFIRELHNLEAFTGGLASRTSYLKPMTYTSARAAVVHSARAAGIQIGEDEVDTILDWLKTEDTQVKTSAAGKSNPGQAVDLLTMQTILFELLESIAADEAHPVIDRALLDRYRTKYQGAALVGQALERWIDRALSETRIPQDEDVPAIYRVPPAVLTGFVRRVASGMAPYLSSGGYKTPAEELSLMYEVLGEDFSRLVPDYESKDRNDFATETVGNHYRLNRQVLNLSTMSDGDSKRNLSGLSLERQWSPAETAEQLVAIYEETKRRLQGGNILKPVHVEKRIIWELVHDKLGNPFSHWADRQRSSWEESIYSLTVRRGEDLVLTHTENRDPGVRFASWQGCWILPREGVILDGYEFDTCNLQGTAFFQCTLKNVVFRKCLMDGVLFINCHFENVLFQEAKGNAMAFVINETAGATSVIKNVAFEKCNVSQMKMSRLQLDGLLTIGSETILYLCDFADLRGDPREGSPARLRFKNGARLEFCAWDRVTQPLIEIERGCNLIASGRRYEQEGPKPDDSKEVTAQNTPVETSAQPAAHPAPERVGA